MLMDFSGTRSVFALVQYAFQITGTPDPYCSLTPLPPLQLPHAKPTCQIMLLRSMLAWWRKNSKTSFGDVARSKKSPAGQGVTH